MQGVGFRPFVYRLATEMGATGWVKNTPRGVVIEVEAEREALDTFYLRLRREHPPRSFIQSCEGSFLDPAGYTSFDILESGTDEPAATIVMPDIATCPDCLAEIFDPNNRRYLYPFTNCTNCGPRFTIIKGLPYDRPLTTMSHFTMCAECEKEYRDPANRRFHAQPNACPQCGPHLELWDNNGSVIAERNSAIEQAAEEIRQGKILALKGIGGFQLLCDARNAGTIRLLRLRKQREEKPFALMAPSLDEIKRHCVVSDIEEQALLSPEAPIVLLKKRAEAAGNDLATDELAPRNPYLGFMLPYSPLHHIVLRLLGFPVVATSGNLSDEPICIDEHEALKRLGGIADMFLVHNRPIVRHADDSILRIVGGRELVTRRARGFAPLPVQVRLPLPAPPLLAVGAHLKNSVSLAFDDMIVTGQHIGDLSTQEACSAFEESAQNLPLLFGKTPTAAVADLHPDYASTHFARKNFATISTVQHHVAHVASCIAENEITEDALGVSWDGTGLGTDGTVWGGEWFIVLGNTWKRAATFHPFRLPGGEAAIREPARTAIGLLYELDKDPFKTFARLEPVKRFSETELKLFDSMIRRGLNAPVSTSAGRFFDGISSLLGIKHLNSFEGQAAMELEFSAEYHETDEEYEIVVVSKDPNGNPPLIFDWRRMLEEIIADIDGSVPAGTISAKFHNTLASLIAHVARMHGVKRVVLSGGCFQNIRLTEQAIAKLKENGFSPAWHQRIPPNDGGIALGQAYATLMGWKEAVE